MEITPGVFDAVDKYNEAMVAVARRLAVVGCYGLLPGSDKSFPITITNGMVAVQVYSLEAVTKSGVLLQISGDTMSLSSPHARGRECFVVVHQDGVDDMEVNGIVYSKCRYSYSICSLEEVDEDCIPLAKLFLSGDVWHVQELYIPPCFVVGAHPELMGYVDRSKKAVNGVIDCLSNKYTISGLDMLRQFALEIDDYVGTESPKEYYLLLKKIAFALSTIQLTGVDLPVLPQFKPFNNNDILDCMSDVYGYIETYGSIISDHVVVRVQPVKEEVKDYIDIKGII